MMSSATYLTIGYGLTWGTLIWYVSRLRRRARAAERALRARGSGLSRESGGVELDRE